MADVTLPQLGETVTEGTITQWFKQVGDSVSADEPLFEVSTDKVDTEVPSPVSGVVQEIRVPEGDSVEVGAVVAVIGPQSSLDGRAVAALVNRADLATVTPSATTFDVTDPALAATFRPTGRATYFRTVGTDLTEGAAMARFAQHSRSGAAFPSSCLHHHGQPTDKEC